MNSDSLKKVDIRILFFAKSRELSGHNEITYTLESGCISSFDLLCKICSEFGLESIKGTIVLAVNQSYCDIGPEQLNLREGDEVAVIPPLSGG